MSAPFLNFLILLRRLVRYGPSFGLHLPSYSSKLGHSKSATNDLGFFRLRNLFINVTYHNNTSNGANNSNLIKCFRALAHTGLARGGIDHIVFHWRFYSYHGDLREGEKAFIVDQELNEDNMTRAVKRGFCHTTSDNLLDGPLDNGEAIKNYEWCCG